MKKIAIVDDDTIFQFTTKVKIEKYGLADKIDIFNDGEEMYQHLKNSPISELPEIILLDINMPIVDGWDFLELYKQIDAEKRSVIKIFMLSSSINPVDVEKAKGNPFIIEYITKPIRDEMLMKIFNEG